ncbi:MAG: hypothetical protein ACK5PG_04015 [Lysobacterales bacterium]|jgi:hypothetical protein
MAAPSAPSAHIGLGTWLLAAISGSVAVLGLAAVWAGVSLHFGGPSLWMSLVVTLDAALLLRLAGLPAGRTRLVVVGTVSLLTVLAAALLISASQIGMQMGMPAQHALPALSPGLVLLYLSTQVGWVDALWLLPAAWLGWRFGR